MSLTHVAIDTGPGTRRVFQVPAAHAGSCDEVLEHGLEVAARHHGVWQINGTCMVRDSRYLAILNTTPVLKEEA